MALNDVKQQNGSSAVSTSSDSISDCGATQNSAITDQKLRLYETILASTPDLVYVFDRDHRFTYANDALLQMWGMSRDEALGKNCLEIGYEPWHAEMHDREIEQVVATKLPIRGEVPFHGALGRRIYDYIFVPVIGEDGEVEAVAGTTRDISDRKEAETALLSTNERIRIALDAAQLVTWEWDIETDRIVWNDRFNSIFGDTRLKNPCTSDEFFAVLETEDTSPVRNQLGRAILEGAVIDAEFRTLRPDGSERWISAYGQVTGRDGDRAVRLSGVTSDITKRKLAEQGLSQSEQKLRAIYDGANEYIALLSSDGVMLEANRASLAFGPSRREDLIGQSFWDAVWFKFTPGARDEIQKAVSKAAAGVLQKFESRIVTPGGETRFFDISLCPVTDEDGRLTFIVAVGHDITEQRQGADRLRLQAALIELSHEPIFVWDIEFGIVEWNLGAERLYGYTRDEALGRQSHALLKTRHPEAIDDFLTKLISVGHWSGDVWHYTKEGRELVVESRHQLFESQGRRLVLETNRDITDSRAAQGILERYRLLSEKSRDVIWFLGADGKFIDVNQTATDTYGYTREEFLALKLTDVRHPLTHRHFSDQWEAAGSGGVHFETVHVRKDGSILPVDVTANGAEIAGERLVMAIVRDITERKAAETALIESEERRHLAQRAGNVGVWDWDLLADRTYWSETMWSIYGEAPGNINPDDAYWSEHLHANDRERVKQNLRNILESPGETNFRDEYRIIRKDGSIHWIEAVGNILRTESGAPTRMYGVNLDITFRKEVEERIRLSENQLRLVTNAVPALISYVDSNERYRFANQKFTDWFGIPTNEIVGMDVRSVLGNRAYKVVKPKIDEALAGRACTFETTLHYKVVGPRFVHISYMPDIGVDGTVYGYYGLVHDLTDLKLSQDLLRSSEQRISLMMEGMSDYAIFSTDEKGRIDSWNKGAEIIYGYAPDEIMGSSSEILFTAADVADGLPNREMNVARENGRVSDDRWHLRKDGTRFFASGTMMPLFVGTDVAGYAKIARDLTEKQRHAEELQRAHDELEVRVAERTKELAESSQALVLEMEERQTAERQKTDLLQRLVSSQEVERRRIARDIHDQLGQRLTALRLKIASLKDFAKDHEAFASRVERLQEIAERLDSEVSFLAWELRPTALDDLGLSDAIGAFVNEWSRHFEIPADFYSSGLVKERLDRETETHVYRIAQEALNNIVKHARAENVTVILERRDENLILIIEDDGSGFVATRERELKSTKGLGLVGMHERATLVCGDVEIESAPGKGTTIFVRVPIVI